VESGCGFEESLSPPEDQAMDRIHRLGQYRPIKITRMIIGMRLPSPFVLIDV
jgi:hypothetical protein